MITEPFVDKFPFTSGSRANLYAAMTPKLSLPMKEDKLLNGIVKDNKSVSDGSGVTISKTENLDPPASDFDSHLSSAFIPPSQVVLVMSEEPCDKSLLSCGGELSDGPTTSRTDSRFRWFPCPNMSQLLAEVGSDLVKESVYVDMITESKRRKSHNKTAAPEAAIINQLASAAQELHTSNKPFLYPRKFCSHCAYTSQSQLVMDRHYLQPHKVLHRWSCSFCGAEYGDLDDMEAHYADQHRLIMRQPEKQVSHTFDCPLCPLSDFQHKGQYSVHLRLCKLKFDLRKNLAPTEDDLLHMNRLFWNLTTQQMNNIQQRMAAHASGKRVMALLPPRSDALPGIASNSNVRANKVQSILPRLSQSHGFLNQNGFHRMPQPIAPRPSVPSASPALSQQRHIPPINGPGPLLSDGPRPRPLLSDGPRPKPLLSDGPRPRPLAHLSGVVPFSALNCPHPSSPLVSFSCEVCDADMAHWDHYLVHLSMVHKKQQIASDLRATGKPPLACAKCVQRFFTYEGLERHLLMIHSLVSKDLLLKVQQRADAGKCKLCGKVFAFNMVAHVAQFHRRQLCSAEIMYSCDVCRATFQSYVHLAQHLRVVHGGSALESAPDFPTSLPSSTVKDSLFVSPNSQIDNNNSSAAKRPQLTNGECHATLPKRSKMDCRTSVAASPANVPPKPQTQKGVRYSCTPCGIKFSTYADVLRHWEERHLQKVTVQLCPIDKCGPCCSDLTEKYGLSGNIFTDVPLPVSLAKTACLKVVSEDEVICLD